MLHRKPLLAHPTILPSPSPLSPSSDVPTEFGFPISSIFPGSYLSLVVWDDGEARMDGWMDSGKFSNLESTGFFPKQASK